MYVCMQPIREKSAIDPDHGMVFFFFPSLFFLSLFFFCSSIRCNIYTEYTEYTEVINYRVLSGPYEWTSRTSQGADVVVVNPTLDSASYISYRFPITSQNTVPFQWVCS